MTETTPEHGNGQPVARHNQRPLEVVVAEEDAAKQVRLDGVAEHVAAEEPEKTRADILVAVETEWDYCGQEPKDSETAECVADILLQYQQRKQGRDPSYVVGENEDTEKLGKIVNRGMRNRDRQAENTETVATEASETEGLEEQYTAAKQDNAEYLAWEAKHNDDFVSAVKDAENLPVGDPASPKLEVEKAKLMQFQRILTVAQTVSPTDHAIISQRMATLDMGQGVPNAVSFIQSSIFSSPENPSGVSEAAQTAIAAEFKLTPRSVVTGSDYADAMGETKTDAQGNEVPVYSDEEPLRFGIGIDGFPSENGDQEFMRATPEHGHGVTIDVTKMSPASKGVVASYLGMWKAAEDAGETDFFLDVVQYDIRGQSVLDEASLFQAARIMNYTFGGRAGYNGEIVRGNDAVGMIQWQAQLRNPKGDAGRSDTNKSDTQSNLQGLAIVDANSKINEEVLKAFGDYSRDNWFGAPGYEDVQAHLAKLFPEKFTDQQEPPNGE